MTSKDQDPAAQRITASEFVPLGEGPQQAKRRFNPLKALVIGGVLLTGLILFFLLSARSVELRVVASNPVDIDVSGGIVIALGERRLMRPGYFRLQASAEGYETLATDLVISRDSSQSFDYALLPKPGILTVESTPAGARVLLDGEQKGITPLTLESVPVGEYELSLERERYQPASQTITIAGRGKRQTVNLPLAPAWAEVTITSTPPGAAILADGETLGETPATVAILEGERQLLLQSDGFATWETQLLVIAGEAQDLGDVALQPAPAQVMLSSTPSRANVTINGEFAGQTPLELALEPGILHRLSLSRVGYRRASRSITLAANEQQEVAVKLEAMLGEVTLQVSPDDAVVMLDGRRLGTGSQRLSLPSFEHSLVVEKPGYAPFRQRFTPRPGLAQKITATLQTEQAARLARVKEEETTSLGQTMKLMRGGEFTMGASRREPGRRSNESLRPVALERMFYIQTTEVSNAQFRLFDASHSSGMVQGNSLNREDQPVVNVSWQQAAQFCNWLSREEGLPPFYTENAGVVTGFNAASTGYRLPTETEWAFAARVEGDTVLRFPWGDTFPPTTPTENYADSGSAYVTGRHISGYDDGAVVTNTVGSYPANARGLHDLGGNVAEWVNDVYRLDPGSSKTSIDPLGAQSGDNFVIRGAGWASGKLSELRLSYRDYGERGRDDVGFRLARYAE